MKRKIFTIFLLLFAFGAVKAQEREVQKATITGSVMVIQNVNGRELVSKLQLATVQLLPADKYEISDVNGEYQYNNVEVGRVTLKFSHVGMKSREITLDLKPGLNKIQDVVLEISSFRMADIEVVATKNEMGEGTSSKISRQAIDHLQATSLEDLLQMLPGVSISNPNMSSANTLSLRTLGGTTANNNMNSLGTSILIDGAPISNNANLQTLAPVISGSGGAVGGGSSPSSGIDVRPISLGNIKSVEIIRGIASVEHGDMTSGVVLIDSEAGYSPYSVTFKTNPYIYQLSASKGVELGEKGGALFVSADYSYNTTNQTEAYNYYQRFSLRGLYTKRFGENLYTNTSLDLSYGMDKRDRNPDDIRSQYATGATDKGFRFNTKGTLSTPNGGWLKSIRYNASISYTDKQSFTEQLLGNAFAPYSMSMTDGSVLSNKPGQKVYDENGNEITNIPTGEENYFSTFLPNEYFSRYDIYGKELNGFFKVNANLNKDFGNIRNKILIGVDYKFDGNLGDGIVYDINNPPYRTFTNNAYRPRAYNDIPFIHNLGVYAEEQLRWNFWGEREFALSAGVRYDMVNDKSIITPRVNAAVNLLRSDDLTFTIRGGYGINAKAPTALYLYPDKAYFDYTNYNTLGDTDVTPLEEQLYLSTTRVFDTENPDLKIATNRKAEVGFDLEVDILHPMRLSVTAYDEKLKDGYNFGEDLSTFQLIPYITYKEAEKVAGSIPKLTIDEQYKIFAIFSKPMNNVTTINQGVEYEIDLGRFDDINTSFYVNGAWMRTNTSYSGNTFSVRDDVDNLERHIGIYAEGTEKYFSEQLNTTFRITHNIPDIGFVFTLTSQINWIDKYWTEYNNDDTLESYISKYDGKVYDFEESMKDDSEYSYMLPVLNENRFIVESYMPTVLFNLMVSKEVGDFLTASFFVNNIFNSRPLYESKRSPGNFSELGIPTFFGFDLKIKF